MRLLILVGLTVGLVGASARIGGHFPGYRKEYGKGSSSGGREFDEDEAGEEEEGDDGRLPAGDDSEGKTEETSVHRKHFMDQYFLQSTPTEYEYGHTCEDPNDWEQRYEKRDFGGNRHQGQVKWGDADGGYGEQLWDFNHDGNIDDEILTPEWSMGGGIGGSRSSAYRDARPSEHGGGSRSGGDQARGVIKERVTITKKKNGKTVDQMKIDTEKLANLGQIVQAYEAEPFGGDLKLMDEFNRKTNRFAEDPQDAFDDVEEVPYYRYSDRIRRMGTAATIKDTDSKATESKITNKEETKPLNKPAKNVSDETAAKETKPTKILTLSTEPDLVSKATINIDSLGQVKIDPVTGSLTDGKTGKKFKIFGILVDSKDSL